MNRGVPGVLLRNVWPCAANPQGSLDSPQAGDGHPIACLSQQPLGAPPMPRRNASLSPTGRRTTNVPSRTESYHRIGGLGQPIGRCTSRHCPFDQCRQAHRRFSLPLRSQDPTDGAWTHVLAASGRSVSLPGNLPILCSTPPSPIGDNRDSSQGVPAVLSRHGMPRSTPRPHPKVIHWHDEHARGSLEPLPSHAAHRRSQKH